MQGDITKIKDHLAELKGEFVASKHSLTCKVNTFTEELACTNECADGHGDCIAQLKGEVHYNEQARAFVGDWVIVLEGDWTRAINRCFEEMEHQIEGQETIIQDLREQVAIAKRSRYRCGGPEVEVLPEREDLEYVNSEVCALC